MLDSIWFSFCCIFSHLFLPFPVYFSNANASSILSNIQLMFNSRKVLISKMGQSLKMMCTTHLFELSRLHCAAGFIVNPEEHEGRCLKCKILQYVSRCTVYFCYSFILYVLKTRELVWNIHLVVFLLPLSYQDEWCTMQNGDNLSCCCKFCKFRWKINHFAKFLQITIRNPPHWTNFENYNEKPTTLHKCG